MKLMGKYNNIREMLEKENPKDLQKMFPHGKPMSRRDLLKAGAIQFGAAMTLPSIFNVLSTETASAAAACSVSGPTLIGLKLNGGAGMLGNFVALNAQRDFHSNYNQLGLGSRSEIMNRTTKEFGNSLWYDASQFLAGIRLMAQPTTLMRTTFVAIPVQSTDDSAENHFDITYFAAKAGVTGRILPNLGSQQGGTGIAQLPALGLMPSTPLAVRSVADISNALTVFGSLRNLTDSQKGSLFGLIGKLSTSQSRQLASETGGTVLNALVTKATGDNVPLVSSEDNGTDPLRDSAVSGAFSTTWSSANNQTLQQQAMNSTERVFATMVYNSLKGNAGTTNLQLGGYDYHQQGRQTQDAQDLRAGRVMGQILESAAIMNRPVMLMVTSDGAVGAPAGSIAGAEYTSDRGSGGCVYLFAFHPKQRPDATDASGKADHQVGQITGEAAVDGQFLTGRDPNLAGLAAFANFTSFMGNPGLFYSIAGRTWSDTELALVTRLRSVA